MLPLLVLAAIAPLWLASHLPLVDLPQHAAQVAALRELLAGNPAFESEFTLNLFTPYLLAYLLLFALSTFMPVAVATQVLVSACIAAFPLATASLLRAVGGDARLAVLALPAAFSVSYYWGFISYLVAVPIALWVLAFIIRGPRRNRGLHSALVVLALTGLFFCHAIAFGVIGLIAAAWALAEHAPRWKALLHAWLPLLMSLPIPLLWLWLTASQDAEVQAAATEYGRWGARLEVLLAQPGGRESITALSVLLSLGALLGPLAWGARPSRSARRWVPLGMLLMMAVCLPSYVFDAVLVAERVGSLLAPMTLLIWEVPLRRHRIFEAATLLILVVWLALAALRYHAWDRELAAARQVMHRMEPGENAAAMVIENRNPLFRAPVYLHYPAWYQAERGGRVDFSFADFHGPLVRYRTPRGGRMREGTAWYPLLFDWNLDGGDRYRYFLVRSPFDPGVGIFKDQLDRVTLVEQAGGWWLYETAQK